MDLDTKTLILLWIIGCGQVVDLEIKLDVSIEPSLLHSMFRWSLAWTSGGALLGPLLLSMIQWSPSWTFTSLHDSMEHIFCPCINGAYITWTSGGP